MFYQLRFLKFSLHSGNAFSLKTAGLVGKIFIISSILLNAACSTNPVSEQTENSPDMRFEALKESANLAHWDPAAPWKLAKGYTQKVVSNESNLNIYNGGRNDWHDMITVNETGLNAGRYLYRTHEIHNAPEGGAVSVVDLKTGQTKILAQDISWSSLDGIRWTPWGSIVVAEEKADGRFFEIILDPQNPGSVIKILERPAVGRLAHEGIQVDRNGNIYVVDEHRGRSVGCDDVAPCGGGIYKFIPDNYGDLSSGSLYVLGITEETRRDNTGQGEWLGPIDPASARKSGTVFGGASFQRPEDLEIINNILYAAITDGALDEYANEYYEGRVISINLKTMVVANFVKAGLNVAVEINRPGKPGHQTGLDSVDNLAKSADGNLIIIEDNKPSDIWFASTQTNKWGASIKVKLFASLTDPSAEGTGIYVSPTDPSTLYVNVQHSAAEDGDGTWAIRRKNRHDDD